MNYHAVIREQVRFLFSLRNQGRFAVSHRGIVNKNQHRGMRETIRHQITHLRRHELFQMGEPAAFAPSDIVRKEYIKFRKKIVMKPLAMPKQ